MSKSLEILNIFNTLALKQNSWKTKIFSKKLEYRFLVESATTENVAFPYKTALLEANVKVNRMRSTKWTYHKEQSLASNKFIFLEISFQFENLLKRVDLKYQLAKVEVFFLIAKVLFEGVIFPVSILKTNLLFVITRNVSLFCWSESYATSSTHSNWKLKKLIILTGKIWFSTRIC